MIPREKSDENMRALAQNEHHENAIKTALEWAKNYETFENDNTFIEQFLKEIFKNNWTRTQSYAYLCIIRRAYDDANLLTERLDSNLDAISTMITGYCAPEYVIHFPGDPTDNSELWYYLQGKWW